MDLQEILNNDLIFTNLEARSKSDALIKMCGNLEKFGFVSDSDEFLKDVMHRETLGSTGIGSYIAIPHGQSDSVIKSTISIAKLNDEIEWESIDDTGAKVIILFVVENNNEFSKIHLKLLAEVARRLANENVLENLLSANTKDEIIDCFK